jgi:hypothetical protein
MSVRAICVPAGPGDDEHHSHSSNSASGGKQQLGTVPQRSTTGRRSAVGSLRCVSRKEARRMRNDRCSCANAYVFLCLAVMPVESTRTGLALLPDR